MTRIDPDFGIGSSFGKALIEVLFARPFVPGFGLLSKSSERKFWDCGRGGWGWLGSVLRSGNKTLWLLDAISSWGVSFLAGRFSSGFSKLDAEFFWGTSSEWRVLYLYF